MSDFLDDRWLDDEMAQSADHRTQRKIMRDIWNRCDYCGKFIAFGDFVCGVAKREHIEEETLYSHERYETLCGGCNGQKK